MRPYFLVLYNKIKIITKRIHCRNFTANGIQMMGLNSKLSIHSDSYVAIGSHFISDGRFVVVTSENAKLTIGSNVYFNEDGMISCKGKISIGNGFKFGPNVKIFDNNHRFDAVNGVSDEHRYGEIQIGENCWIGSNVVILKGTKIGKNCVVGAGCVVNREIPEGSIVTQGRDLVIERMR